MTDFFANILNMVNTVLDIAFWILLPTVVIAMTLCGGIFLGAIIALVF